MRVLIIDDRLSSAALLTRWLAPAGVEAVVSATWAEAADTLSYQQLAGTALPDLLIGPLAKDGIDTLGVLRGQGIDIRTAVYTESRSHDQDAVLASQYRLAVILHKPFADADRVRLLGDAADAPARGDAFLEPELPPAPAALKQPGAPLPGGSAPARPTATPAPDAFDDLIGNRRGSSVRADAPPPKAMPLMKADELPSGVQRLLVDPMAAAKAGEAQKVAKTEEEAKGPRSIAILVVDDKFNSAAQVVERLGMPGQLTRSVPTFADALGTLERMMVGNLGCELVIGPLSAEGVAAVREYRKRGWGAHVVLYTESVSQSQDARLPIQYGCLAILRRPGLAEPLERFVQELRSKPKQAPAQPQEAPRGGVRQSGVFAAPTAPTPAPAEPARSSGIRQSGLHAVPPPAAAPPATRSSGLHTAPPPAARSTGTHRAPPAAGAQPPLTIDTGKPGDSPATRSAAGTRMRRSIGPVPTQPPAAGGPPASAQSPLEIDVPGGDSVSVPTRVVMCVGCKQEFVTPAVPGAVRCPNCGVPNKAL